MYFQNIIREGEVFTVFNIIFATTLLIAPFAGLTFACWVCTRSSVASMRRDHCISMNIIKESVVFIVLTIYFCNNGQRPVSQVFFARLQVGNEIKRCLPYKHETGPELSCCDSRIVQSFQILIILKIFTK